MKQTIRLFVLVLLLATGARAQQLVPASVDELYPAALQAVQEGYGTAVAAYSMGFMGMDVGLGTFTLDISSGLATGWIYAFSSPDGDTTALVIGIKDATVGPTALFIGAELSDSVISQDSFIHDGYLDSPQALTAMKNAGLSTFMQSHSNVVCSMLFAESNAWTGYYTSDTDPLICIVDLYTGQSIECAVISDIRPSPASAVSALDAPYPNPYALNSSSPAVLRYSMKRDAAVRLVLYDAVGRELGVMFDGNSAAGTHTFAVPRHMVRTPGIYFIHLVSEGNVATQRLLVTR